METTVRDLMTSPAVTCAADDTLAAAARVMQEADTGSVVVTDDGKVVGILTERDLLRAAAGNGDPEREQVRLWMTSRPDVLGPEERVDAAWASLTSHHYRHLPVVEGQRCVGVVSLRDLMGVARIRPGHRDERGRAGRPGGRGGGRDDHRRRPRPGGLLPLPAVLGRRPGRGRAPSRTSGTCSSGASCPTRPPRPPSPTRCGGGAPCRRGSPRCCRRCRAGGRRSTCCAPRSPCSGSELGWRPTHDIGADELYDQAVGLCAVVPTILAAAHRLRSGQEPVEPQGRPRLRRQLPLHADRRGAEPAARPGH